MELILDHSLQLVIQEFVIYLDVSRNDMNFSPI